MKKIRILCFSFITFILLISSSYPKSLPPGSGTADIPSNVLILLDKSGSMIVDTSVGATLGGVRSMHPLGTGDVIFFNNQRLKRLNQPCVGFPATFPRCGILCAKLHSASRI